MRIHTGAIVMAGFFKSIGNLFTGTPEKRENVSTLLPQQQGLADQAIQAGMRPGAGGAFGDAADYYRNNLSDNPADFDAFAAPALRQYNQDIMPGISEQFAGMGAGGLSSSGFRNAQVQGATDLSERLGALRANLRQQSAQGLQGIGQAGLQNFSQNMETQPGTQGFLPWAAETAGNIVSQGVGAPLTNAVSNQVSNWFGGKGQQVAKKTDPYNGNRNASPTMQPLPNFSYNPGRGY